MKLVPQLRIAQKLPLVVVGVALLALICLGVGSYLVSAQTVTKLTQGKLTVVAKERARELSTLFASGAGRPPRHRVFRHHGRGAARFLGRLDATRQGSDRDLAEGLYRR